MDPMVRKPCAQIDARIKENSNRIKVGDVFPNEILSRYVNVSRENFSTAAQLQGRRVVIFTVPDAFTPTCSGTHLDGYKNSAGKILGLGIDKIICIVPNGVDIAKAWNEIYGSPSIEMWADNLGKLTDKLGLGLNMSGDRGHGYGMQRSAMVVSKGVVEWLGIEEKAANCQISHATSVESYLLSLGAS